MSDPITDSPADAGASSERRHLTEEKAMALFVTRDRFYAGLVTLALAILAGVWALVSLAERSSTNASSAATAKPVAELDARVRVVENEVSGLKQDVQGVKVQLGAVEGLVRSSETTVRAEIRDLKTEYTKGHEKVVDLLLSRSGGGR